MSLFDVFDRIGERTQFSFHQHSWKVFVKEPGGQW